MRTWAYFTQISFSSASRNVRGGIVTEAGHEGAEGQPKRQTGRSGFHCETAVCEMKFARCNYKQTVAIYIFRNT